ncbi:Poly(A) RNA polymerase gld-2 [Echinococcus granulosus]|nr:Poly(A) RNA polymerase gld-2 [Echinococcus granulosus]
MLHFRWLGDCTMSNSKDNNSRNDGRRPSSPNLSSLMTAAAIAGGAAVVVVDPRLPALGMFVKHWAQKMAIHGGNKGRLSTYALMLMVIQFLQCGCSPPVVPNLQARFPKLFDCKRALEEVDMDLELPWNELRSANRSTLGELFAGFMAYYADFDFARRAISIRNGRPLAVDAVIQRLPSEKKAFKIFVEGDRRLRACSVGSGYGYAAAVGRAAHCQAVNECTTTC